MNQLWVASLGTMSYAEALELQRSVAKDRISGAMSRLRDGQIRVRPRVEIR